MRANVMQLAREKKIDAILVTEISRRGRCNADLINSLEHLADWGDSLIAQTGMEFDLTTASGRLMVTVMAGFSQFERDLIRERTISGLVSGRERINIGRSPQGVYPCRKAHWQSGKIPRGEQDNPLDL